MNKMIINEIDYKGPVNLERFENLLEQNSKTHSIGTINWSEFSYKPDIKFRIGYCQNHILLKYNVSEESVLAKETSINGSVHKDSCVEFFIATNHPDNNQNEYYNFEFSCIGIPHVAYGPDRYNRKLVDPKILKLIKTNSTLGDQPFDEKMGGFQWEIMIVIPKDCFVFDKDIVFKGLKVNANFYKCGDATATPHYITWNPIETDKPDYHRPDYFGELLFD